MASILRQDRNLETVWLKPHASKSSKKGGGLGGRKPLGDLTNAVKNHSSSVSLNQTSKKAPVSVGGKPSCLSEEPLAQECEIADEGFLHNHEECIKARTRAMDLDEFMEIIGMENDCSMLFGSPRLTAMTHRFEPDSPERIQDFELSPAGRLGSSPSWSPPSSPELELSWMDRGDDELSWIDDDIFNFKLKD